MLLLISIATTPIAHSAEPTARAAKTVLVNRPLSQNDKRYEYPHKLLERILSITEVQYGTAIVKQSQKMMARDRTLIELEKAINIHVMVEAPKPGWEERLIPIRIPIRKGIQGYRTFLILKKNQPMLSTVTTLRQLKKIPTGSGQQWSTTKILRENGFNVREGTSYEGLFSMLAKERFVTFGRGINETAAEYEIYKNRFPELAIEQNLLLYIPLPTYFFVTPKMPWLAHRIEDGLNEMIANGSFDIMFQAEFGQLIKDADLSKRRVFKISNSNLSPETPLDIARYWYQP